MECISRISYISTIDNLIYAIQWTRLDTCYVGVVSLWWQLVEWVISSSARVVWTRPMGYLTQTLAEFKKYLDESSSMNNSWIECRSSCPLVVLMGSLLFCDQMVIFFENLIVWSHLTKKQLMGSLLFCDRTVIFFENVIVWSRLTKKM